MRHILVVLTAVLLLGALLMACTVAEPALSPNEGTAVPKGEVSSENNEVSWTEALEILSNGDVKLVSQSHDLKVSLVLNDDRTITTVEPSIDAIINAVAECGEACSAVVLVTE